jgi:hypothetical protein
MIRASSFTVILFTAVGIMWGGAMAVADSAPDTDGPPLLCPSNVCQTAAGPVRVKQGDRARLAVHNHSDQPVFVIAVFVDAATGEILREGRSEGKILDTGQFMSFEFVSPSNADVIAGFRVSFVHQPKRGGVGARLEITDGTSNTIMFSEQLPKQVVTGRDWSITSGNWAPAASAWDVGVGPAPR